MANTPARGAPNPDRPRLSASQEAALAPVDRRSAEGYTAVENVVEAIDKALADGAITVTIEVTDTIMHKLEEAKVAADPDPEDK
jgi:hypothetical protein